MPFKSDKQRKYLWSQKPEVAKKFAQYHFDGGSVMQSPDMMRSYLEQFMPKSYTEPQKDAIKDNIIGRISWEQGQDEPVVQNFVQPPKPESRWSADWNIPIGHALGADWNTYGSYQDMSEGSDPWSAGIKGTWRFAEGGGVPEPMNKEVKKLTQKDRYGNQVTYEFAEDVKPIDQTEIIKELMKNMGDVPEMEVPMMMDHPGEPKGTDTVPAWLTPGEFVVNKEATEIYGDEIKAMNDHGREIQKANKGMEVPEPQYVFLGKYINKAGNALTGGTWNPYVTSEDLEYYGNENNTFSQNLSAAKRGKRNEINREQRKERWEEGTGKPPPPQKPRNASKYIRSGVYNSQYDPRAYAAWKEELDAYHKKYGKPSIWDKLKYREAGGMIPNYYNQGDWVTDAVLDRLMEVESGGDPKAKSKAGAIGLYQWLPSSAKKAGYGVKAFDPLDAKAARAATKQYLQNMQKYHGFTPEETLRAYNWGPGNVINYNKGKRKDIPAEALNYPGKILGFDNVEGVNVPYDMPVPTVRPDGIPIAETPTSRNEAGMNDDALKSFLSKYMYDGGNVPHLDTIANEYNTYKPMADSIALGGEEDVDYTDIPMSEVTSNQNPMYQDQPPVDTSQEDKSVWQKLVDWNAQNEARNEQNRIDEAKQLEEGYARTAAAEAANKNVGLDDVPHVGSEKEEFDKNNMESAIMTEELNEVKKDDKKKGEVAGEIAQNTAENDAKNGEVQTGPDKNQPGNNATEEEVTNKGNSASKGVIDAAKNSLLGAFGDLFDSKELGRMAILYAGSRLMGYSHGGSLQYAAKQYLTRVDAKAANHQKYVQELTKSGKYTTKSVSDYNKSKDINDLIPAGVPVNPTGQFKTFFSPTGQKVRATQVKQGKSTYWVKPDGSKINASYTDDASMVSGTKEFANRVKQDTKQYADMISELRTQFGTTKTKDGVEYSTKLAPTVAGNTVARWSIKNGVPADMMGQIVENAYHSAIQHSQATGEKVRDLTPFLNNQWVIAQTGDASLFTNKKGQTVKGPNVSRLFTNVKALAKDTFGTDLSTAQAIDGYRKKWSALDPKEQEIWNDKAYGEEETGFMKFIEDDLMKTRTGG